MKDNVTDKNELRQALEDSVKSHLMSDVPYGVLLSGGLDSSIISAITKKYAARRVEDQERSEAWWPQLHSFAVGLPGSPDLKAAQEVANHLGTVHHEIHFTVQEGLDAIRDVIYHIETYDVTTIRASTPMYLMSRKIKAMGIKMVLSGEGSDEVFGGYLYFHKAPNAKELHEETVRKLLALHMYDCARANKAMSAWGVEARVPFLDKKFLDVAMRINPQDKMCGNGKMEKHILRECFESYLPASVAWRQKEQFSDGVGYSWIDTLKEVAAQQVSDQQLETAASASHTTRRPQKKRICTGRFLKNCSRFRAPLSAYRAVLPSLVLPLKRSSGMRRSRKWTILLVARLVFTSLHINKTCNIAPEKSGAISVTGELVDSDTQ